MFKLIFLMLPAWGLGAAELPTLSKLPAFEFQNDAGKKTSLGDLKGKIWVADFIFTRCQGQCPVLSQKMADLQAAFTGRKDLRFVSFSVDPKHDTPNILAKYGKRFRADPARWFFLTGPKSKIDSLTRDGFRLAGGGGDEIGHSFRFVLVDKSGQIRGYYSPMDPEKFSQLKTDLNLLLNTPH